jgi:hypothetical protein
MTTLLGTVDSINCIDAKIQSKVKKSQHITFIKIISEQPHPLTDGTVVSKIFKN